MALCASCGQIALLSKELSTGFFVGVDTFGFGFYWTPYSFSCQWLERGIACSQGPGTGSAFSPILVSRWVRSIYSTIGFERRVEDETVKTRLCNADAASMLMSFISKGGPRVLLDSRTPLCWCFKIQMSTRHFNKPICLRISQNRDTSRILL